MQRFFSVLLMQAEEAANFLEVIGLIVQFSVKLSKRLTLAVSRRNQYIEIKKKKRKNKHVNGFRRAEGAARGRGSG